MRRPLAFSRERASVLIVSDCDSGEGAFHRCLGRRHAVTWLLFQTTDVSAGVYGPITPLEEPQHVYTVGEGGYTAFTKRSPKPTVVASVQS
jgi:hypothetical protein